MLKRFPSSSYYDGDDNNTTAKMIGQNERDSRIIHFNNTALNAECEKNENRNFTTKAILN